MAADSAERSRSLTLPSKSENHGFTNKGNIRRIPVACARCRKRKIRCSGDPGDGSGCRNCKRAGADISSCQFHRVGLGDPYKIPIYPLYPPAFVTNYSPQINVEADSTTTGENPYYNYPSDYLSSIFARNSSTSHSVSFSGQPLDASALSNLPGRKPPISILAGTITRYADSKGIFQDLLEAITPAQQCDIGENANKHDVGLHAVKSIQKFAKTIAQYLLEKAYAARNDAYETSPPNCDGHETAGSSDTSASTSSRHGSGKTTSSASSSRQPASRKRERSMNEEPGDEEDDSEDENDRQRKKRGKTARSNDQRPRRLKCPYYQRRPEDYYKGSCRGAGFVDMGKLKDHLKRVHTRPIKCSRCWEEMVSSEVYDEHLQRDPICQRKIEPQDDRVCARKLQDLNFNRTPFTQVNIVEEKWKILFRILFPQDEDVPSPYEQYGMSARFEKMLAQKIEDELMKELAPVIGPAISVFQGRMPAIIQQCKRQILDAPQGPQYAMYTPLESSTTDSMMSKANVDLAESHSMPHQGVRSNHNSITRENICEAQGNISSDIPSNENGPDFLEYSEFDILSNIDWPGNDFHPERPTIEGHSEEQRPSSPNLPQDKRGLEDQRIASNLRSHSMSEYQRSEIDFLQYFHNFEKEP
ncbi:hypothetical protein K432DRAFT_394050 [Lepidopterella palustris CBS 459.81]|uniref:Zn(2)-C6 fungal-type domain-containing protein n=1 Tax=Lepidopterella palustris CBS 459.81 TaxID=1314670 RepID=A0A8E2JE70_9PEZI|nr:hypothetical protein K432DRAFT_394050 [Lepidopterella palustris CBS 459.81]